MNRQETILGYTGTLLNRRVVTLPDSNRFTHTLVTGMTGSGKTTTLRSIINQDVSRASLIVLDGKGDRSILGPAAGRFDSILFGSRVEGNLSFNPLLGPRDQVVSSFIDAMGFQNEFFEGCAAKLLYVYLRLREISGTTPNIRELADLAVDLEEFDAEIKLIPDAHADVKRTFKALRSFRTERYLEFHAGLSNRLNTLIHSKWIEHLCGEEASGKPQLDFAPVFQRPGNIYVGLQKLANLKGAAILGKLLLARIGHLSADRAFLTAAEIAAKPTISVVVDELASLAYQGFETLPQTVRSTGIMMTLATQTVADLRAVSKEFADQIKTNTGIKIIHKVNSEEEADSWARLFGSTWKKGKLLDRILAIMNPRQFGDRLDEEHWIIHPNILKNLARGQALVEQEGPAGKSQLIVQVFDLEAKLRRKKKWEKLFRTYVTAPYSKLYSLIGLSRLKHSTLPTSTDSTSPLLTNESSSSPGDSPSSSSAAV